MTNSQQQSGIAFMLIASFCFAFAAAIVRKIGLNLGVVELVFFRNLIGVFFVIASFRYKAKNQIGGRPLLLVFRGVIGTLALYSFFYSVIEIGLAEAVTYQQSYPILLAVLSLVFFKEKLGLIGWSAVLIGFVGICFLYLPETQNITFSLGNDIIGIVNALFTALAYLSIKGLSKFYETRYIVLSFMLSGIVLPLLAFALAEFFPEANIPLLIETFIMPKGMQWLMLLVLGVVSMIGQIFLTRAFSNGRGGVISTIGYSNIAFSMLFGWILGDSFPNVYSLIGIALIIISGILIAFFSSK